MEAKKATCASRIKQGLNMRGLKQSDLCAITKIPKSAMSQYISGSFEPKQDRIYLIAKALDVNEAWLMGFNVSSVRDKDPFANFNLQMMAEPAKLTESEQALLDLFRQVPEDQQQLVLQMIRAALNIKG